MPARVGTGVEVVPALGPNIAYVQRSLQYVANFWSHVREKGLAPQGYIRRFVEQRYLTHCIHMQLHETYNVHVALLYTAP